MAALAQKWNNRALTLQCFTARAVMFDEYMDDEAGAQRALDEAVAAVGEDVVFSRARARVYWRHNKHAEAVNILREIADIVGRDSPVDRAFAMREAAISAANTGDWKQATAWFDEAQKAAVKLESADMQAMAVGLEADTAVAELKTQSVEVSLRDMAGCLVNLAKLKPDISVRTAYCHRVVRHTVLWMDSQLDERDTLIDGKPILMLPGTCSNPDPPASIAELPLGPLDMAWYMLAEAEVSSGYDVNIANLLRKRLSDGPIIFLEVSLRTRRIFVAIKEGDSGSFSSHLAEYLAAIEYMRSEGKKLRESFLT